MTWFWGAALAAAVAPLWASQHIPMVDLPQHLHLISVLHRLDDPSTLYPEVFTAREALTPYLGYYYVVSALSWLLPLELANRLFLCAVIAGLPLALAFLLRGLHRPAWPALLAVPFAYGDSFAWGFVNYMASLPLALLTCGLFLRAIDDGPHRVRWATALAASLVAVLLFHVQAFAWLALALPWLLVTTPAPGEALMRARLPALLGVIPGVALFVAWVGLRIGQPAEIAPGEPWRAWGPMLSPENLAWKTFEQNRDEFFALLGNIDAGGGDRLAVRLAFALAAAALVAAFVLGRAHTEGIIARWRIVGLAALALVLYFALPFDIRGYVYYLNSRYAHLAAALLVTCVPPLKFAPRWEARAPAVGLLLALVTLAPLWTTFHRFDEAATQLDRVAQAAGEKPRVMGLVYAPSAPGLTHPVFLHAASVVALLRGGLTNFSFALTPHSPLRYRGTPPPTFPSEWRPDQFRWEQHGPSYDHFLLKGVDPARVFGSRLQRELELVATSGDFALVRRR